MKKLLPILLCLLLLLSACTQQPVETLPSTEPSTEPSQTQTETPSEPETEPVVSEEPSPEEVHIGYDPDDGKIVVYMGIGSIDFRYFSIAPAGTEDWVRLESKTSCYNEDVHDYYGMSAMVAETEYEDCTLWDLKAEVIPGDYPDDYPWEITEYSCEKWLNLDIHDGHTRIVWRGSQQPIPEKAVFCQKCTEPRQVTEIWPENPQIPTEETEPVEISYDPDDGKLVVYMQTQPGDQRIYYVAPYGAPARDGGDYGDWIRLELDDAYCGNEDVHGDSGLLRYTVETDYEDCTLWALMAEVILEADGSDASLTESDTDFCGTWWELEIHDGQSMIVWQTDVQPVPKKAVFCPNCLEKFE